MKYGTWRLDREGLVAPAGQGRTAITDKGRQALAKALTSPPRLSQDTIMALNAIEGADRDGLLGRWPGPSAALDAARVFDLVRSTPADAMAGERATWQLTDAGRRELQRASAARRRAAPMSRTQADVVRAVACDHPRPVASDRSYASCHRRGWLTWAGGRGEPRREVTPAGWLALVGYHRRASLTLRLPVRFLVPGHVVRPPRRAGPAGAAVRVVRVTPVTSASAARGYVVLIDGPNGRPPVPYPDRRPLPPAARFEVVDYQPLTSGATREVTNPQMAGQHHAEADPWT